MPTKDDFSCGGVVWDPAQKQVLLVNVENFSKARVWTFPKGHPEAGETDEAAALREVREETGWNCAIIKKLSDISYFYVRTGVRFHKTVRWFFMKPIEKVGTFAEKEILDAQWFSFDDASARISYDSDKKLLKELPSFV
jgi:8-oxo-dGTP pyrophosphatase MutT (NUDIX family)